MSIGTIRTRINSKSAYTFVAYSLSGFIGFSIDLSVLWLLLYHDHAHYLVAVFIGYLVGVSTHFMGCRFLIFSATKRLLLDTYIRFIFVALLGAVGVTGIVAVLVEFLRVETFPARVAAAATVGVFSFFTHRRVSFGIR